MRETNHSGYPSVDKPWLKYYSEEAVHKETTQTTIYGHLFGNNKDHLTDIALIYFDRKITYQELFDRIEQCKLSLLALGIGKGDIITIQTLAIPQTVILLYALSRIGAVANLIYVSNNEQEVNALLKKTYSRTYFVIDNIFAGFSNVLKGTSVENVVLLSIDTEMDFVTRTIYRFTQNKKTYVSDCKGIYTWSAFMKLQPNDVKEDVTDHLLPVAMTYTGGTTGTSKAVVLTNRSINELVFQYEKADMGFDRQRCLWIAYPHLLRLG